LVQLLGPAPLKFGRAKNIKLRHDFGQLETLIVNISGTNLDIDKWRMALSTIVSPTLDEKDLANFGHQPQS